MKVHILQHVPFEGIGSMAAWLSDRAADARYTRFYESPLLPDFRSLDLLIVMGGPMSVNDEREYPWLRDEKEFIRQAIRRGTPALGVCLGAQLMASALGAGVYPNAQKEIGWFPVESADNDGDVFHFPPRVTVFHWHGETFDLPEGAALLASSAACKNQAFQIGGNAVGLQFHLETTPETAALITQRCRHELVEDAYIQTEHAIRAAAESACPKINRIMDGLLSYITR